MDYHQKVFQMKIYLTFFSAVFLLHQIHPSSFFPGTCLKEMELVNLLEANVDSAKFYVSDFLLMSEQENVTRWKFQGFRRKNICKNSVESQWKQKKNAEFPRIFSQYFLGRIYKSLEEMNDGIKIAYLLVLILRM